MNNQYKKIIAIGIGVILIIISIVLFASNCTKHRTNNANIVSDIIKQQTTIDSLINVKSKEVADSQLAVIDSLQMALMLQDSKLQGSLDSFNRIVKVANLKKRDSVAYYSDKQIAIEYQKRFKIDSADVENKGLKLALQDLLECDNYKIENPLLKQSLSIKDSLFKSEQKKTLVLQNRINDVEELNYRCSENTKMLNDAFVANDAQWAKALKQQKRRSNWGKIGAVTVGVGIGVLVGFIAK